MTQFRGWVGTGGQKFLAVVMSIRNLTRGIISNLVATEILGRWNYLLRKKERNAISYFINVQLYISQFKQSLRSWQC